MKLKNKIVKIAITLFSLLQISCDAQEINIKDLKIIDSNKKNVSMNKEEVATLGAGCFWCIEAQFLELKGVTKVVSGYSGGKTNNPTYKEVCSGLSGHAEVIQVIFDPSIISFDEILIGFWSAHDPTTLNKQGNDEGTQYRSVIFYHSEQQKEIAEKYIKKLNEENTFGKPVVTEVSKFEKFYEAEDYHQNYYNQNETQPYCMFVIKPKMEKFKSIFGEKLKQKN